MSAKSAFVLGTLLVTALAVGTAQTPPAQGRGPAPLQVHPVKPGKIYWVEGGGGNTGIVVGDDGVILIDVKTSTAATQRLIDEVKKLTPKPITTVILTHSDADHVNGLPALPASVAIVAHVNNRLEQQNVLQSSLVEVNGGRCLPPADRLPNRVVRGARASARIAGVDLVLHHFAPGHTSGDLVVHLPEDKVVFAGDLITNVVLVHPIKHGSFAGWFTSAQGLLRLDADQFVGGHASAIETKEGIRRRMAEYGAIRDRVAALVTEGRTLPEVKAALNDPERSPMSCRGFPWATVPELAYHDQLDQRQEIK